MMDDATQQNASWLNSTWLFLGLMLVVGLLIGGTLRMGHDWGDDFASYIMQSQSIVTGSIPQFLEQNRLTIKSSQVRLGPIAYPWGTSLLLSPIIYWKGLDIQALKGLNIVCFFLFLTVIWFGLKKYLSPGLGLVYFALFAFNPFLLTRSLNNITSDIPFLFFSTFGMLMIRRVIVEEKFYFSRAVDLSLLGLAIAFAITVRLNGILLFVTLFLTQAIQNDKRCVSDGHKRGLSHRLARALPDRKIEFLMQALPYVFIFVFSFIWMAIFPVGGSYGLGEFVKFKLSAYFNSIYYYFTLPSEFFYPMDQFWLLFVYFSLFTFWGAARNSILDYDYLIYCGLNILLLIAWAAHQGLRFIFPILPFLMYFFLKGIQQYWAGMRVALRKPCRWGISILLGGIMIVFAVFLIQDASQNLVQGRAVIGGPYSPAAQDMLTYIVKHVSEKELIVFYKPRALRLLTRRPAFALFSNRALEQGDYILLDLGVPQDWNPLKVEEAARLEQERKLELVYFNANYRLYAVNP